jgi:hypothetical protein
MSLNCNELIRKITGVAFNMDTDSPSCVQVETARAGELMLSEYPEDESGNITGPPTTRSVDFVEMIDVAIGCVVWQMEIMGLTRDEAVTLLLCDPYREKTFELVKMCGVVGGLEINGTRFELVDGKLVNEDFGPWPFDDQ